jgi:enoyl-CoA hydratase
VMILPWVVGPKIAKEIILTGEDSVSAERAREIGMINRVVPEGEHLTEALRLAARMAAMDDTLVRETKRAINRSYEIRGMAEALESALQIDTLIEGEGMETKRLFLEIAREQGLRAAIDWRDARMAERGA